MLFIIVAPTFLSRRGVTSVIAMMYLVVFATLALGFYTSMNSAVMVSDNEVRGARSLAAAESGMDFIRYQLARIKVPANTQNSDLLSVVAAQLSPQLDFTANMKGHTVFLTNGTIYLPSSNDWIAIDPTSGMKFRIAITQNLDTLVVKSVGMDSGAATQGRGVQLTYQKQGKGGIFNFGMASKGTLLIKGSSIVAGASDPTAGSVYSALGSGVPLTMAGSSQISGDFSYNGGTPSVGSNATIAGQLTTSKTYADHVHSAVSPPDFPIIDTSVFYKYVLKADGTPNYYVPSMGYTLTNVVLPPGNYSFGSGFSVEGVLYIQAPSTVKFGSVGTIRGVVVVENNPTGNLLTNTISMAGKTSVYPIDTLPAGDPRFPPELRAMTGSFLLAPNFNVSFAGAFDTVVSGSIIAGRLGFASGSGGVIKGSIIALDPSGTPITVATGTPIQIERPPAGQLVAGVTNAVSASNFVPVPGSYDEVKP